jgi:hypothetical protein
MDRAAEQGIAVSMELLALNYGLFNFQTPQSHL